MGLAVHITADTIILNAHTSADCEVTATLTRDGDPRDGHTHTLTVACGDQTLALTHLHEDWEPEALSDVRKWMEACPPYASNLLLLAACCDDGISLHLPGYLSY